MSTQTDKAPWHLDKTVNLSVLLAALVYAATTVWFLAGLRKDVDQIKEAATVAQAVQKERDARQDESVRDAVGRIEGGFNSLAGKVDRLIERNPK